MMAEGGEVWRFELHVTNPSYDDYEGNEVKEEKQIMRVLTKRDMSMFVSTFNNLEQGEWGVINPDSGFWEDPDLQHVALVEFKFGWDNYTFASGRFPQAKVRNLAFVKLHGEELEAWKTSGMDGISERVAQHLANR